MKMDLFSGNYLVWVQFLISATIIVFAGWKLSFYGSRISEETGLSKLWVGIIFLGIVTSLPEIATGLGAVCLLDGPDLSMGDVLGSNIFNLMIIAFLDLLQGPGSITSQIRLKRSHIISAGVAVILAAIVILSIWFSPRIGNLSIWKVGVDSIAIAIIYIIGMRLIFRSEDADLRGLKATDTPRSKVSSKGVYFGFSAAAIGVIVGGIWLANTGDQIAAMTGWGRTFVGTIFLAIVTSLPEIVASVACLRLGSLDMAFGNIFGSNMINLFAISIFDTAYRKGPILSIVAPSHMLIASLGIFLTLVAVVGLFTKSKKSWLCLGWDSIVMILGYLVGIFTLFKIK